MDTHITDGEPVVLRKGEDIYLRTGGCLADCGACCEFLTLPLDPRLRRAPQEKLADFIYWAKLHGIEIYESGDWLAAKIPLACTELTDDKRCGVYGTPARPTLCSTYPKNPLDLDGVDDVCGYRIQEYDTIEAAMEEARQYHHQKGGEDHG